jgi:anti-anti-sigma factor
MPFSGPARAAGPLADLALSTFSEGAVTVIALRGEADVAILPALIEMLARVCAEQVGPVVVDMTDTRFVDSATVRTLLRARQFLGEHGRELTFRAPSRQAARLLAFAGLADLIRAGPATEPVASRSLRSDDPGELAHDPVRLHLARAAHPSSPWQG